jgi:type I restriction enzyme M protein
MNGKQEEKMPKPHESDLVRQLGFISKEKVKGVFTKEYTDGYVIKIDFEKEIINFGKDIEYDSKTTQNFSQAENFVVLECVDRLLEKGYKPKDIILEKVFPSGHGHSGKLDIFIQKNGEAFLMIECKTWGKEYDKETSKMFADGGQLFTYFKNATSAKHLCLYTSSLIDGKVEYANCIVDVAEDWKYLSETKDIHESWNKIFKQNGIFEEYASAYNIVHKKLTYGDLAAMNDADSGKIFHQIMTILRQNGVSDKPNAFNKLLNLFVCKIIDENKNSDEELDFQCWEGLANEDLQMTLNDLYKRGMNRFLNIKIFTLTKSDVDKIVFNSENEKKEDNRRQIIDQILKTNPNFAFVEVLDDKTFQLNANIVREIVELLQQYKFRYEQKQEFLGNFFEKMLNTSMKQEAGQFFTPVPITRFIISSMPLRDFVQKKIDAKEENPLPTIIDYACGSGHFLTEYMSTMQKIIEAVIVDKASPSTRNDLKSWRGDVKFKWADEYVYGIDFDNRLVKTTKVSAFFNGDGEATIIWGDGLDSFEHSEVYRGKLKETMPNKKDNGQFDILISNPPYSVDAFRRTLKHGAKSFDLYSALTDNSSEIECLFIERMKQLLKEGGWAGIILPSSILSNTGIYTKAREILLLNFDIIGITELGSNTFMATGTNTVVLFLRRKNDTHIMQLKETIASLFNEFKDCTVNGIENAFSSYLEYVWNGISLSDYKSFLQKEPNETVKKHTLYKEYRPKEYTIEDLTFGDTSEVARARAVKRLKENQDKFWSNTLAIEKEKFLYFVISYAQKVVLVETGEKDAEKRFLGYEFSNRRGSEGIHPIQRGKTIDESTKLFDDKWIDNPEKASAYILKAFLGDYDFPIHESLKGNISRVDLVDMLNFDRASFEKTISTAVKKKIKSKREKVKVSDVTKIISGGTPDTNNPDYWGGKIPWLSVVDFNTEKHFVNRTEKTITEKGLKNSSTKYLKAGDLIISARGTVGALAQLEIPMTFNQSCYGLRGNENLDNSFLYYILKAEIEQLKNGSYGSIFKAITTKTFDEILIPLPPLETQQMIVEEIEVLEKKEVEAKKEIEHGKEQIKLLFTDSINTATIAYRLSDNDIFDISIGKRVIGADIIEKGAIPVYSANVFEPFGYTDKNLITDFSIPSVLWGIDGDWQVNYMLANKPFYPTDHCGVLRVKSNTIVPKYLAWILNKEGIAQKFSRTLRASIDRIKGLTISVPPIFEQQKIISNIEKIETEIQNMQKELELLSDQKKLVLKNYL